MSYTFIRGFTLASECARNKKIKSNKNGGVVKKGGKIIDMDLEQEQRYMGFGVSRNEEISEIRKLLRNNNSVYVKYNLKGDNTKRECVCNSVSYIK